MDDLDEVTKGERAATYEEVDKYLGHALIAEGLVPFTYTADQAIWWWKSGGYKVLGESQRPVRPHLRPSRTHWRQMHPRLFQPASPLSLGIPILPHQLRTRYRPQSLPVRLGPELQPRRLLRNSGWTTKR